MDTSDEESDADNDAASDDCTLQQSAQVATIMAEWLQQRDLLVSVVDSRDCNMIETALAAGGLNRVWGLRFDTYIGRYSKLGTHAAYTSATCVVWRALDRLDGDAEVALKIVTERDFFESEVQSRWDLDDRYAVMLKRVHVSHEEIEHYRHSPRYPTGAELTERGVFLLVMPWCNRSLDEVTQTERIAGNNVDEVRKIALAFSQALQHMHQQGYIHGEKQLTCSCMCSHECCRRCKTKELPEESKR